MDSEAELKNFPVPMIGIAAYSGTGKTTLLLKLLPVLKARGLRVAVVKHAHHDFDMDYPGKDSYRLREAGADEMLVAARCRFGLIRECRDTEREPRLAEALALLDPQRLDLVLVEGFKKEPISKIELRRAALDTPWLHPRDLNVVAVASDQGTLPSLPERIAQLSIEDAEQVADFICEHLNLGVSLRWPTTTVS